MLTPHQSAQLQKNYKDNAAFFQLYGQELAMKRQIREKAIDFAMKINFVSEKSTGLPQQPTDPEKVLALARDVFNFIIQDGDLDAFAQKPTVQLAE